MRIEIDARDSQRWQLEGDDLGKPPQRSNGKVNRHVGLARRPRVACDDPQPSADSESLTLSSESLGHRQQVADRRGVGDKSTIGHVRGGGGVDDSRPPTNRR